MIRMMVVFLCCAVSCLADDIYLKNGFVHRNVRIVSSEGDKVVFMKNDTLASSVRKDDVARIERITITPQTRYGFEVFDILYEQPSEHSPQTSIGTTVTPANAEDNDTLTTPLIPSRHNALRFRGDWGRPVGMKVSAGYIAKSFLAMDLFISNYGTWSQQPNNTRFGLSILLFSNFSLIPWHPVIPYLQIERGVLLGGIFGGGDNFSQAGIGLFVPVDGNTGFYVTQSLVESVVYRHSALDGLAIGVEAHFSN